MEGMSRMFGKAATHLGIAAAVAFTLGGPANLSAQTPSVNLTVNNGAGTPIGNGFRWLLQEDQTIHVTPGIPNPDSLSFNFHRSYMPVVDKGEVAEGGSAILPIPDPTKRYFVSVLPHCATPETPANCYAMSGASIASGQLAATVVVPSQPVPTAQIFVKAFEDRAPINNAWDMDEIGLGGFSVVIADAGGPVLTDAFGNPMGTIYRPDGTVDLLGTGVITTITQGEINAGLNPYNLNVGEAVIKNIPPGKYGVDVIPVLGSNWQQTSTIEGKKTIDAWVIGKESRYAFDLNRATHHGLFGFVRPFRQLANGGGNISGRVVNMHMSRPPDYTMHKGHPLPGCWVGLNQLLVGGVGAGLYAAPCNSDSTFSIPNIPPGTYQLVIWDQFLDVIFARVPITVAAGNQNFGDIGVFRWFAGVDNYVFFDTNKDGIRNPGEPGMRDQNVLLRFRDGSIYQAFPTDLDGFVPFDEVFPFFAWLVAEVDFARFKTTGVTVTVDGGGPVAPGEKLTPQIQADGAPTRTETGPAVLVEAFQSYLGTTNQFDWGKTNYLPGENGGISGIVQYGVTRAEDNPAMAAAEPWETGIPRVPVFLYRKDLTIVNPDPSNPSKILNVNGVPGIQLADVDHAPFGWSEGGAMGPEDVKRNNIGGTAGQNSPGFTFSAGDAVQFAATDSWDDSPPTECPGNPADPFYRNGKCYDGLRNYNQVRPGVFDGGYAFTDYVPGGWLPGATAVPVVSGVYVVEAVAPKGYEHQSEESKNVDFGETYIQGPLALPPACVGNPHTVPAELTLFPGVAAPNAGVAMPLCDRKETLLTGGMNAGVNFFLYTDVPLAAQVRGMILNDLANEFDQRSPSFSEKVGVSWLPVSIRDWTGKEIVRVYTDQFGMYNAMVPSTYTINAPTPSGVVPNVVQLCLNSPGPIANAAGEMVIDPYYNKHYAQVCWNRQMEIGKTFYADTPILPVAAFVGPGNPQLDCECADHTPKIFSVTGPNNSGPFIPSGATGANRRITIRSMGTVEVPDPNAIRTEGNLAVKIARDFGFGDGTTNGVVPWSVTIGGIQLQNVSWSNSVISGDVPIGTPTGQLVVTRGDSGFSTVDSVTVTVGNTGIPNVRTVAPGQSIQAALDASVAGDLILVQPGTYTEMLIMTKPVKLQGFGAGSTHIIANQSLTTQLQAWREKMNILVNCPANQGGGQITLLPTQRNNTPVGPGGTGRCGFVPGTGLFLIDEGAGITVATRDGVFTSLQPSRIDGFSVVGSMASPGILVNGYARYLEISNNLVANNQGTYGGGIRLGDPILGDVNNITISAQNDHAFIHHNHIVENGTQIMPGAGVALYNGSDNYQLTDNYICGNFAQTDGAGVAHYGLSRDGLIARNKIVFNQTFVQQPLPLGGTGAGGGLMISGLPADAVNEPGEDINPLTSEGSGSVTVVSNLIQGNNAGTGDGAGVLLRSINGLDVTAAPTNPAAWYHIELFNNIIVNNVAGLAGGGIAIQDAAKVTMINNTVAHNDSTATANLAFSPATPNQSNPQPAGIVSSRFSLGLCQAFGELANCPRFSNPVMENNIVLNNRSMFWQVNTALPVPIGELQVAGVNDLAVWPPVPGFSLDPRNGILSSTTTGYHASNQLVADSLSVFANPYTNAPPAFGAVQPNGTITQLEFTTSLVSAAAIDEGGNFINVHYGPLTPGGSYHLQDDSPAIDAGNDGPLNNFLFLGSDYDGQTRPLDGNRDGVIRTDIGADERAFGRAPVITSNPILKAVAGELYSYQMVAHDPDGGTVEFDPWGTNPAGLNVTLAGLVTWNPTRAQAGPQRVQLQAIDEDGLVTEQNFTVMVNDGPPVFTTQPPLVAYVGLLYSFTMHATDLDGPVEYDPWGTTNPAGLTVGMTTGLVTWTPTADQVGVRRIQLQASDVDGQITELNFDVTVSVPPQSVDRFTLRNAATDAVILDSLTNGAIVDRLVLCPNVNCQVNFQAVMRPVPPALPFQSVVLTLSGATSLTRTDNTSLYTMPDNPGGNFAGLTLNPGQHTLTAVPYMGPNGTGMALPQLTVNFAVVGPPVFTSPAVTVGSIGNLYTYDANATSLSAGALTYSLQDIPPAARGAMTIVPGTGVISWTPAIASMTVANPVASYTEQIIVRATDSRGRFTDQTFNLVVSPKPETITATAVFHNLPGGNGPDFWTISGTSTVTPGSCTGTPNVCGNLTIRRTDGNQNAVIGSTTVSPNGTWTFTSPNNPAIRPALQNGGTTSTTTIRVLSQTGGVLNTVPVTVQPN
jgi:large repetitive protein